MILRLVTQPDKGMHRLMKILECFLVLVLVHSGFNFLMTFEQDILFVIMSV